jgi:hypothetical protein
VNPHRPSAKTTASLPKRVRKGRAQTPQPLYYSPGGPGRARSGAASRSRGKILRPRRARLRPILGRYHCQMGAALQHRGPSRRGATSRRRPDAPLRPAGEAANLGIRRASAPRRLQTDGSPITARTASKATASRSAYAQHLHALAYFERSGVRLAPGPHWIWWCRFTAKTEGHS